MKYVELGKYVVIKTGKLDANASNENGFFPFLLAQMNPEELIHMHLRVSM